MAKGRDFLHQKFPTHRSNVMGVYINFDQNYVLSKNSVMNSVTLVRISEVGVNIICRCVIWKTGFLVTSIHHVNQQELLHLLDPCSAMPLLSVKSNIYKPERETEKEDSLQYWMCHNAKMMPI